MDYKISTINCYNQHAEEIAKSLEAHFTEPVRSFANEFSGLVSAFADKINSRQPRVLDLGSGPGHHSEYFKEKGLVPLCVDLSEEMIKRCRQRNLAAQVMDMENLQLPANRFHGVWAYCSLLHIPKKNLSDLVENQIVRVLKLNGYLGIAVKDGIGEGFEYSKRKTAKRWFTYFTDREVRQIFQKFTFLRAERHYESGNVFLQYIMQLKLA